MHILFCFYDGATSCHQIKSIVCMHIYYGCDMILKNTIISLLISSFVFIHIYFSFECHIVAFEHKNCITPNVCVCVEAEVLFTIHWRQLFFSVVIYLSQSSNFISMKCILFTKCHLIYWFYSDHSKETDVQVCFYYLPFVCLDFLNDF